MLVSRMQKALLTQRRRVVVTGVGVVSPLGLGKAKNWESLLKGENKLERRSFEGKEYTVGICPNYEIKTESAEKSRFIEHAVVAAEEAVLESGLHGKCGVSIGSGIGGLEAVFMNKRPSPFMVPRLLINTAASTVARRFGLRGPNLAPAGACAAGAQAIGEAFHCIQREEVDLMVAGGTEACVYHLALSGFQSARALGTASRPFDTTRNGFVLAEGAAILVLEDLDHALRLNKKIYAELIGYGHSCDAHHPTAPLPSGESASFAMRQALRTVSNHDNYAPMYINAHAAGTPKGDQAEIQAIASIFASSSDEEKKKQRAAYLSSTKGATGHLLGAAGAIEALFSCLALDSGVFPHTLNLKAALTETALPANVQYIKDEPLSFDQDSPIEYALSNSFGFGGVNSALCFRRYLE